jgi:hypothetical protein
MTTAIPAPIQNPRPPTTKNQQPIAPPARAPKPASSVRRSTRCATVSLPAPLSCPPRTPRPTSATSTNFSMSTPPQPPPKLNSSTKSPTSPGASTAFHSSKPSCFPTRKGRGAHHQTNQELARDALRFARVHQKSASAWSADNSPKPPNSSYANSAKDFPAIQRTLASFSQKDDERHAQHLMRHHPALYAANPGLQAGPPPTRPKSVSLSAIGSGKPEGVKI